MLSTPQKVSVAIIGGGPAGLTTGYSLSKGGAEVTILEADPVYVGGISRTATYKGFHFDIGGHRFFSKSKEVEDLWTEILPRDMLVRPRSSRINYRGKFFSYPLKPFEALFNLGFFESILCVFSYLKAQLWPVANPRNFEEWVTNQFGARLFRIFFKTYTEKVWGMSCQEISADWAAQRIKGLSLFGAVMGAFLPKKKGADVVKTLIDSFRYPRKGPGMMWDACADHIRTMGGEILMGREVVKCSYDASERLWTITHADVAGHTSTITANHLVSSTPMRSLATLLVPSPAPSALQAAGKLSYRDFLTVVLICRHEDSFADNWIYIHEPNVKVGRVQNFKSWSPEMVPDPALSCYGLEYFCFEGDDLWTSSDEELLKLAAQEMEFLKLVKPGEIVDGCVVRQPKAYPVYDDHYAEHVETMRVALEAQFPTLHLVGRNGMHKYNNQDHSMMTAMLTAKNILAGEKIYDVWEVNEDAEYHEGGSHGAGGLRSVPNRVTP